MKTNDKRRRRVGEKNVTEVGLGAKKVGWKIQREFNGKM